MAHRTSKFASLTVVALFLLFVAVGCGKKDATPDMGKTGENTTTTGTSPAKPGSADDKPTGPAIKSSTLSNFLPKLSGYEMKNPEHVDMNMNGMNWSSAKSDYTQGDNHVSITIFDYNHQMGMAAAYTMFLNGYNIETDDEITRSDKIGGYPGWISWKKKQNNGSVGIVLADRIFVVVESSKIGSIDELKAIAEKIDLAGLSKAS